MSKIELVEEDSRRMIYFWCPACQTAHGLSTVGQPSWEWNNDLDFPTTQPSADCHHTKRDGTEVKCHYYLEGDAIRFCADSSHELAGQRVPIPDWKGHKIWE
jgi:hypothetical protein